MTVPAPLPLDEVAVRTSFARFRVASIVEGIALLVLVGINAAQVIVVTLARALMAAGWLLPSDLQERLHP